MRHRPHLVIPAPWEAETLRLRPDAVRHLATVLRYAPGSPVTYTDGEGMVGAGTWSGEGVSRGDEHLVPRVGTAVTIAVASPAGKDRQRFIVEKLQELSVERLVWLRTAHGGHRVPSDDRSSAWAASALEQSRGAWRMVIGGPDPVEAHTDAVVADPAGPPLATVAPADGPITVVVGPEGGFTPEELGQFSLSASLGETILRTDTAAIVVAGILRSA